MPKNIIRHVRERVLRSEFVRNILTLMTGAGLATVITLISSPILTRLYQPHEYGIFGLLTSIVAILTSISAGRYETAIVLASGDREADNIVVLCLLVLCFLTLITAIICIVGSFFPLSLIGLESIKPYMPAIPPFVFLAGFGLIATNYLNRLKKYKTLSLSKVIENGTLNIFCIFLGAFEFGIWGLLCGYIIGRLISAGFYIWKCLPHFLQSKHTINSQIIWEQFKKFKSLPIHSAPGTFLGAISTNLSLVLILSFYGASSAGHLSLANGLLALPMRIISNSFSQVFNERMRNVIEKQPLVEYFKKSSFYLGGMGLLLVLATVAFPIKYMALIFGQEWYEAFICMKILVFGFAVQFVFNCLLVFFIKIAKESWLLSMQAVNIFFIFLSLTICHWAGLDFFVAITILTVLRVAISSFSLGYLYMILNKSQLIFR